MLPSISADPQMIQELLRLPEGAMVSLPRISTCREVAETIIMSTKSMAELQQGQMVLMAWGETGWGFPHR